MSVRSKVVEVLYANSTWRLVSNVMWYHATSTSTSPGLRCIYTVLNVPVNVVWRRHYSHVACDVQHKHQTWEHPQRCPHHSCLAWIDLQTETQLRLRLDIDKRCCVFEQMGCLEIPIQEVVSKICNGIWLWFELGWLWVYQQFVCFVSKASLRTGFEEMLIFFLIRSTIAVAYHGAWIWD